MPTVPRYQRSVAPQQRPSGALRAVETETSAGVGAAQARAYVGRGAEQLGGAIADVGAKFLNIAYSQQAKAQQEAKDYADQLAILGASNKLATWERTLYEPETGAFNQQGEAAFGLPEKVTAEFDTVASEIEQSLSTPEQKLAFAKIRSSRGQSVALDIERHVSSEIKQFALTELQAAKKNNGDAAILKGGAGDFPRANEEMDAYATSVRTIGKRLGMGPEAIEEEIRSFRSAVHVGIIQQLVADEHVEAAKRYYEVRTGRTVDGAAVPGTPKDHRSEIEGEALDDVTKLLKQGNAKQEAQQLRDDIQAKGGTLQEQINEAKARSSGDVEDLLLDYLEHDHTVTERLKDEQREATSKGMVDILERTRGNLRAIQSLPGWTDSTREQRAGLRAYAKSLQEGTDPTTDWKAYYGARTLALDDPQAFARLDLYKLYRGKLANSQFEQLIDIQSAIRNKDVTATQKQLGGVSTDTQIWNDTLKDVGLDDDTDAARKVRTRWEQMVKAEQTARGKELDETEKRQMLDLLVMDAATATGSWKALYNPWSYDLFDQSKKGYQVTIDDIPQSERQQIVDALRSAKPPLPATEANILATYLRSKRAK